MPETPPNARPRTIPDGADWVLTDAGRVYRTGDRIPASEVIAWWCREGDATWTKATREG